MRKKFYTQLSVLFVLFFGMGPISYAAYQPVTLAASSYNADIVANGIGSAITSTNANADGGTPGYSFLSLDFKATSGSAAATYGLPINGLINSAATSGLGYQLADYSSNNALRLQGVSTGTLTFGSVKSANEVYVLAVSGSGTSNVIFTVNFSDATSQVFTSQTIGDWYDGTVGLVMQGIGRVRLSDDAQDGNASNPRLYQYKLTISAANYSKQITSITVNRTGGSATNATLCVMGVSINELAPCAIPTASATALNLAAGVAVVNGSFTAALPAPDKYLIVRSAGALVGSPVNTVTYTAGQTLGNGTVVSISTALTFTDNGLTGATSYTYNVFSVNDNCAGGPTYKAVSPLTGTITTSTQKTYTWNGSSGTDWQVAANWTPTRTVPDSTDYIVFNNASGANLVTNIPTQKISRLTFSNNTTAAFQSSATAVLTIFSDNNASTDELGIAAGSSLILYSDISLTLAFGGIGGTATVAGNLEASTNSGTVNANFMNFTNSVTTVTSVGTLTVGSTINANGAVVTSTAVNLFINGTYNHTYTISGGSAIPTATWGTGSTCAFVGYTTATGGPNGGGTAQTFYNVTYNCPGQTSVSQWSGEFAGTITGTLTVTSTGTGTWAIQSTQALTKNINNYVQTGGTVDLGTSTGAKTYNFSGSFNQTGGVLKVTGTGTGIITMNFNGTTAAQNVKFFDAAPVGQIVYQVTNPNGINLTGAGALTTAFNINTSGGVTISSTAANPINTTLALTYAATGTTLNYNGTGNTTATAAVFPATNGPLNLTANVGAGNALTIPFSRTIGGTLTLTTDVDIATNTLTLGTAASALGTLAGTGNIRVTTGNFTRWFGTTASPTAVGNIAGSFPLAYGTVNRNVSLYFSAAAALTTGGTISVGHTNASGTTAVSVTDAGYTIDKRLNSYWSFNTGNGIVASGTVAARVTGGNLFASSTIANVRLMKAASVSGIHVSGTGVYPLAMALRNGLAIADITSTNYYIGAATADINTAIFTAIANGNWSTGATWDQGSAPSSSDIAVIGPGITVTADAITNVAGNFTVSGILNVPAPNTITLSDVVTNNGTINITGGTLKVGPDGGGNKSFTNNATVTVSNGNLIINGNLNNIAGSTLNQSGGAILVDGNAAGNAANSVAASTAIVSFKSSNLNLTGGTFTIADAHASSTASSTFEFTGTPAVNIPSTHTFIWGDGISTDVGGNATNGFRINPGTTKISFGNVIVNTGIFANSFVTQASVFGINGNLTINAGAELRNSSGLYITGNLVNNTGGTLTSTSTLFLGTYLSGTFGNGIAAQTVSGTGTFRNAVSATPVAKFVGISVRNGFGVTFNIGSDVVFSGTTTFAAATAPSLIYTASGTRFVENAGAGVSGASATAGWFACKYQKACATGGINNIYNVGTSASFTQVTIASASATAVATAGNIAVEVVTGDHPQIATSGLNAAKSVNKYYAIEAGGGINFSPAALNLTLTWVAADLDAAANFASLTAASFVPSSWTLNTTSTQTATSIVVPGLDANITGEFQVAQLLSVPVKVSSFTGRLVADASAELKWTVETMTNFSHFELQRSPNGTSFNTIASLAVAGSAYIYNDNKLLDGNNYYRLKMIDKDGSVEYSKVVVLKAKGSQLAITAIMPTVTTGNATIKVAATKDTQAILQIIDSWGRVVMRSTQIFAAGITNMPINSNAFAAGIYTVQIITADETVSQRLIKQ